MNKMPLALIRPVLLATFFIAGCAPMAVTPPALIATVSSTAAAVQFAKPLVDSPVVFRFATVGDSRQQPKLAGNSEQDEIWLQNTPVWSRMLHEIEQQKPHALVFNGDMIHGYTQDMAVIDKQYAFWRGMVAGLMERGTYVLPVPGNHEVQMPTPKTGGGRVMTALATHEDAWRANMGDLVIDQPLWNKLTGAPVSQWRAQNTPALGVDGITTSQRQLSYSFDAGAVHIAVINTDPVGRDSSAPVTWLRDDFAAAKARGAKHFFVFGHKPAFVYNPANKVVKEGRDELMQNPDALWDVVEAFGATYFCGHQHVYHASQPRLASGGKAWQVIVGSGGSPLSFRNTPEAAESARQYAWADVKLHQNGQVSMQVWGFDAVASPTRLLQQVLLTP